MKKVFALSLFACSLFLCVAGCGDSAETKNMVEGAKMSDIEAYEAAVAANEAAMNASMETESTDAAAAAPAKAETPE